MGTATGTVLNFPRKKVSQISANPLISLVPEAGVEPAQAQGPGDFESPASPSSTTPAMYQI